MKLYFECNFFEKQFEISKNFSVIQNEINLKQKLQGNKFSFEKKEIEYFCRWHQNDLWDPNKPCILMPIRDNLSLLKVTLSNFKKNNVFDLANVIVIDDRSMEDLFLTSTEVASYLRVDNEKGFNFSMLMNIAAGICKTLEVKEILLWNCDLWCPNTEALPELLKRHRENNSVVSGTKLLYPPAEMSLNNEEDTQNIKEINKNMLNGKWRETVQYGGDAWILTPQNNTTVHPVHLKRFAAPDNPMVNCNRGSCFITGALQLWNLEKYIELGGLNPSLSRNFQDVDLCLRAAQKKYIGMYFGKDLHFYHDESAVFNSLPDETKFNKQMESDNVLFGKIWNSKIMEIIF